ncbi:unnamed protein product [Lupinus luteus]|uniref:Uncharacterized protein n=1 Tax=Lupinus luteus TaxID=3873 RepID=A0AAV1VST0_LUPLU
MARRCFFKKGITFYGEKYRTRKLTPRYSSISSSRPASKPRFIQHKKEAFWFYRFLSIGDLSFSQTYGCCSPRRKSTLTGFKDTNLKRIGPKWYHGVRHHGLIMGCSVTSVKPSSGDFPLKD